MTLEHAPCHDARPSDETRETVVVVGNGMVGHRFCESLTDLDKAGRFRVLVLGEEPRAAYDRVALTRYFSGKSKEDLELGGPDWYAERGIELHLGARATLLDTGERTIHTSQFSVRYDHLVLATGSAPFVPPIAGVNSPGVFVYRTLDDLDAIMAYAEHAKSAAVMGGGLLGLEAAKAVKDLGLETHVVEMADHLMPRQLDARGARLLRQAIEEMGVHVHLGKSTKEILGTGGVEELAFSDGTTLPVDMLVISAGIRPRDELAKTSNIQVGAKGGVVVDDTLRTSAPSVYAIGEVALHQGSLYGLVAPGYDMADVLAKNLTDAGPATFSGGDLSAKLKLLGVDVANFGQHTEGPDHKTVVYEDLVQGVYKKLVVSKDVSQIVGGILVGDTTEYAALHHYARSGEPLEGSPSDLILGARSGSESAPLPESAVVCSCNNVTKGAICSAVRDGLETPGEVKNCTKAGAGCGGCFPLVTDLVAAELKTLGRAVKPRLCEHFAFTRQDLFEIVRVKGYRTFREILRGHGAGEGCEICKPAVASILASIHNEVIVDDNATLQDTNDRFLANIQRRGLYSVIPRVPGGEITPEKLIVLGQLAQKYGLYTKITGGQRIDLLGARVNQLPEIWEELIAAGFESGHAYGKALRTVKSCVGDAWCRYGVQDSVGFAIRVEERYRGIRAPHKLKSAVSGCVRECAEAQSKDFGLIATEKGWNLFVCGNGGSKPRHADLLASDLDEETVIRYVDRFLMFYVRTADKLTRTSVWLEKLEGGIEHLRDVVMRDSLGLCEQLEADMQRLVDTYQCEWKAVVENPKLRAKFKHFANVEEGDANITFVDERGQKRPQDWAKEQARQKPIHLPVVSSDVWVKVARVKDVPSDGGISIKYGSGQLALYHFAERGQWFATQNACPHMGDQVLARGIIGDQKGVPKVACPLHKQTFSLESGESLCGEEYSITTFEVRVSGNDVIVKLPPPEDFEKACTGGHHCADSAIAAE